MKGAKRLYERAGEAVFHPAFPADRHGHDSTPDPRDLKPLWHVSDGRALFAGPLNHNAPHAHSAAVFLVGLYGPFRLRVEGSDWRICRTAAIRAGVAYEFDIAGEPLGVFYLEPNIASVDALMPLVGNASEVNGALIGRTGEIAAIRALFEDCASRAWIDEALGDLLNFTKPRARRQIDPRIARVTERMAAHFGELTPAADYAEFIGLSASRFQHLFTQEVGVPYRRYRAWQRLRAAIGEVINGSNFTHAAQAAGFYDQAHFAHDFHRTFGAPASPSLMRLRR